MLHSAALIKVIPQNIRRLYLNLIDIDGGLGKVAKSGFGIQLHGDPDKITIIRANKSAGEGLLLKKGDSAVVSLGSVSPSKYQALLAVNPQLTEQSNGNLIRVTAPTILEPYNTYNLSILIEVVHGELDLNNSVHNIASIYLLA